MTRKFRHSMSPFLRHLLTAQLLVAAIGLCVTDWQSFMGADGHRRVFVDFCFPVEGWIGFGPHPAIGIKQRDGSYERINLYAEREEPR